MTDLFDSDLTSERVLAKAQRTYSQRNVSALQFELIKNRKMINIKPLKTTIINRTLSFKPLPLTSSSLTNVENTPRKQISYEFDTSSIISSSQDIIEETPIKEENDTSSSDIMTRHIQRLAIRLRSSIPVYDNAVFDNQSTKPATLHLSQIVNRISRCNYVLRRFVREAQKYSPKSNEIQLVPKPVLSYEKGRRRLFNDSPKPDSTSFLLRKQPKRTPRKASGVIKQLFASPSSSFKRTSSSPSNTILLINDKRPKLF